MERVEEIQQELKKYKEILKKKYRMQVLGIFGSWARGEQTLKSDLDILVEFEEKATLLDFIGACIFLEEKLGRKIDIVPKDAVREEIKGQIMKDFVRV